MSEKVLLSNLQMAEFVNNGFVRLDEVIPQEICDAAKALLETNDIKVGGTRGCDLMERYPKGSPIDQLIRVPEVLGMIESLVGPNPRFDHHAIHRKPAKTGFAQILHQDAEIDVREDAFDIQLSFFVHDTPLEMGGTRFLPGSHFRRVHETQIGRYQNVKGMYQVVCKAGTVVAWHHNIWHGAQPNLMDEVRYMFKLRLNPMVKQQLLWNHEGLSSEESEEIAEVMFKGQPWYGQENRIEIFNRIRMWRFLTNNPDFDREDWFTRVENIPN